MSSQKAVNFLKTKYVEYKIEVPSLHIVLGSGLGIAFEENSLTQNFSLVGEFKFTDVPGLPSTTVLGHSGVFKYYRHLKTNKSLCIQIGRLHGYDGHEPKYAIAPLTNSFLAGTKNFVLTNAAGSLTRDFQPGSVMIIDDHINLTGKNPLIGPNQPSFDGKFLGPRFPDMTTTWDKETNQRLSRHMKKQNLPTHSGIYLGLMGPNYETPAEVTLFARWGLQAVGMSTVWEALQLRYLGAKISGLSFISNLAAGLSGQPLSHEEVEIEGKKAAAKIVRGLFEFAHEELS